MKGNGDFSIGSDVWPGISKLIEECGEVIQVAGKLMGSHGERNHWDGSDLKVRLEEEIGDAIGAMHFVTVHCDLDAVAIHKRAADKLRMFEGWHRERSAPPPENVKTLPPEEMCQAPILGERDAGGNSLRCGVPQPCSVPGHAETR